ncbi:tripartite tricarboxylate transporter substrate binding protein [Alcaligenaceae bacterium]|nr:tripartite tricarboxylate transporter substrate binding protein [Alcaligenaceae bacterium]
MNIAAKKLLVGVGAMMLVAGAAHAQAYPSKPITLVVPFNAGGAADSTGRLMAEKLSKELKVPVIVQNKPGVSGIVGAAFVKDAQPDGYTVLLGNTTINVVNPLIYKSLPYDAAKDFVPVTLFSKYGNALIVRSDNELKSLGDIIETSKATPGKLTYGTAGTGTSQFLSGKLLERIADIKLTEVPYKGGAAAITDLLGGHIDMIFETVAAAKPFIDSKQVRVLGVTSDSAQEALPEATPISEMGFPQFHMESWFGLFLPKGTPAEVAARLNDAMAVAVKDPEVGETFRAMGSVPESIGLDDFSKALEEQNDVWKDVLEGIQL